MNDIKPSSPGSFLARIRLAGYALGTTFSRTLRREFVTVKEVIETEQGPGKPPAPILCLRSTHGGLGHEG